jgi:hypothetical protein
MAKPAIPPLKKASHSLAPYLGLGAATGHTFAQEPQSMQASSSMMYLVSPAVMQLTGHSGSHAPQLMQSSLITYAISYSSHKKHVGFPSFIVSHHGHAVNVPVVVGIRKNHLRTRAVAVESWFRSVVCPPIPQ